MSPWMAGQVSGRLEHHSGESAVSRTAGRLGCRANSISGSSLRASCNPEASERPRNCHLCPLRRLTRKWLFYKLDIDRLGLNIGASSSSSSFLFHSFGFHSASIGLPLSFHRASTELPLSFHSGGQTQSNSAMGEEDSRTCFAWSGRTPLVRPLKSLAVYRRLL